MKRFIVLLMCAALLLTGCGGATNALGFGRVVRYEDMVYQRPDMDAIEQTLADSCQTARDSEDLDVVVEAIWTFYDVYDQFYDCYNLAYIGYNADMNDYYWKQEYEYCVEHSYELDAGLEELYSALAVSPVREELESDEYFGADYFDDYEDGGFWDDTLLELMDRETAITNEYYEIYAQSMESEMDYTAWCDAWAEPLCRNFVELVAIRQEIAAYCGYESYPEFAYDFYYYRDYTCQEAEEYLLRIQQELVDLYQVLAQSDVWELAYENCSLDKSYDFLQSCAKTMGGTVYDAFELLDEGELYDISYSPNKNSISFELYFSTYYEPFIFVSPSLTVYDKLTLVHEFGHFANDYASAGSYAGIDVAEVFSQGMEYLSLCCGEDTQELAQLKMADCLCVYVEQAAFAAFEHQVYDLTGDELTEENVFALFGEISEAYGLDAWGWDSRGFVEITHFYTNPMYVISYVVSNDVALQLYQMEQEEPGSGLAVYEENLDTQESYFLAFVESAGFESPFTQSRVAAVRETMETFFGN